MAARRGRQALRHLEIDMFVLFVDSVVLLLVGALLFCLVTAIVLPLVF